MGTGYLVTLHLVGGFWVNSYIIPQKGADHGNDSKNDAGQDATPAGLVKCVASIGIFLVASRSKTYT